MSEIRVLLPLALLVVFVSCTTARDPALLGDPSRGADRPLNDPQVTAILQDLAGSDDRAAERAVELVVESNDERFVAVFIELLRANQIGAVARPGSPEIDALHRLTGKRFGGDWQEWVEWYGGTELAPPSGFAGWKGRLLATIDPAFARFIYDDVPSTIPIEEIQWGGVAVDGIPALDDPAVLEPENADFLTPDDPVFGIEVKGEARAYPLRILDWHEMVNDKLGGVSFSLAYCTLCGSGVAYIGMLPDGEPLTFGSSGLLHQSNKLMYDRQTRSLWAQFTGEPVLGSLVNTDIELERIPVVLTRWRDWVAQHDTTTVLDIETGFDRPYELGAAYGDYFSGGDTMFPVGTRSGILETKERIFGLDLGGAARAYPVSVLAKQKVVNDVLGGKKIVIVADKGTITVAATERPEDKGDVFYQAGGEVRAYAAGVFRFSTAHRSGRLLDKSESVWRVTERALVREDGESLKRLLGQDAFWFAWFSFFPNTSVYR